MSGLILGLSGLAVTATTTAISFSQAAAEKRKSQVANRKAAEMMMEARKRLDINVMDELSINKEAYELQSDAMLTQGATALQAAQEGSARGAAAAAGRVQMAQNAAQAEIRSSMSTEVKELEKLSADEEARLLDVGMQLDLGEVEGAQLASVNSAERSAAAEQQGLQGLASTTEQAMGLIPLYTQNIGAQKQAMATAQGSTQVATEADVSAGKAGKVGDVFSTNPYEGRIVRTKDANIFNKNQQKYFGQDIGDIDIQNMTNKQFRQFKRAVGKEMFYNMNLNKQYTDAYTNPLGLSGSKDEAQSEEMTREEWMKEFGHLFGFPQKS